MTVTTTATRVAYLGDGITITPYAVPFSFMASADLVVTIDGVTQTLTTNYTVSGGNGSTGTVSFVAAPAVGVKIVIRRQTARTRTSNYVANDPVPATTLNNDPDKLTRIVQEIDAKAGRALRFPDYEDAVVTLPGEVERAGGVLVFNDVTGAPEVGAIVGDPALVATEAEAVAGVNNAKQMTPFRTTQSLRNNTAFTAPGTGARAMSLTELFLLNPVTPQQYSTTTVTDLKQGLDRACAASRAVFIPPGSYNLSGALAPLPAGTAVFAFPGTVTITEAAGNYNTFEITGSDCSIIGLTMQSAAKTGGYTIKITCSGVLERTRIEDITTFSSRGFLTDSGASPTHFHTSTYVSRCQARAHKGPGVALSRAYAFIYFDRCAMDYVTSVSPNHTGWAISDGGLAAAAGGIHLDHCTTLGTGAGSSSQHGFIFTGISDLVLSDTKADSCGGRGLQFNSCLYVDGVNSGSGLCDNTGVEFSGCQYVVWNGMRIRGRAGVGTPSANVDALLISGASSDIAITGLRAHLATGHGINKTGGSAIVISGATLSSNTLRGVKTVTGGAFALSDVQFNNNTAGNYDLGSSLHHISDWIDSAGSWTAHTAGAGTG